MADNTAPRSGKGRQSSAADRNGRAAGTGRAGANGAGASSGSSGTSKPASGPASGAARAVRADEVAPGVVQAKIEIPSGHPLVSVFGAGDGLLRVIEKAFPGVDIHARGNQVTAAGSRGEVALVQRLFEEMLLMLRTGAPLTEDGVERSIQMLRSGEADVDGQRPAEVLTQNILSNRGRTIRPKTLNQKNYVDAIDVNTIVFGIGPAGSGKTYLAMAKAVQALQSKQVNRIILTRPAVEAGEKLGFLPGTLYEKIDPYLRPLYDALHDMIDPDSIPRLMAAGVIEVAPLAYMRGRTLNDAFIILDEAQNTSPEQMKMFLTRLGFGSKIVVTGDVTQVDLPGGTESGLRVVRNILSGVEDIHFAELTSADVVRHRLVGDIVDAYGRFDAVRDRERGDHSPGGDAKRKRH
ncbi:phosphate starvation-inducible PhoH-like protein [Catenulispora sp. MAP5-51]|uniref:PhoH family protein n=1 Tax=Catenulispora sp. MAP5-51 TaxID=3156298 RepID=UPI003511FF6D